MFIPTRIHDIFSIRVAVFLLLLFPVAALAMQPLSEGELEGVTAGGFSNFLIENNTAKMWFNMDAEINAHIETFKANYGLDGSGVYGWDQDWSNVYIGEYVAGEPQTPLLLSGFAFEAQFDNITADNKHLLSLKWGFTSVEGQISADFDSFSGYYDDVPRKGFYRADADTMDSTGTGRGTFTFDKDHLYIILEARGVDPGGLPHADYRPGFYFDFGGAQFTRN